MIADSFGSFESPVEVMSSGISTSPAVAVAGSTELVIIRDSATPNCWVRASGVANVVVSPANFATGAAKKPNASAAAIAARAPVAHAPAVRPLIILTTTPTPAHVVSNVNTVPPQLSAPSGAKTLSWMSFCNPTSGPVIHPTQLIATVQSNNRHSNAMTIRYVFQHMPIMEAHIAFSGAVTPPSSIDIWY